MKKKYSLLFLFFILIFFGCKNDENIEGYNDSLKVSIVDTFTVDTNSTETFSDERIVLDTQILFFMPSPSERQEIIKFYGTYDQYQFQSVFNNFVALSNTVKSAMKSQGITVEVTYAKMFIFPMADDTMSYSLELEGQILGFILSDGVNVPLIRNGVQKTKDVSNDIRNFYNLSNFSIAGY